MILCTSILLGCVYNIANPSGGAEWTYFIFARKVKAALKSCNTCNNAVSSSGGTGQIVGASGVRTLSMTYGVTSLIIL